MNGPKLASLAAPEGRVSVFGRPRATDTAERIHLMGCSIDNLTMAETLCVVEGFVADGSPHQQVSVNVDKLVKVRRDPALAQIINSSALVSVDGMPVVWASRLLGRPLKERVAGIDLFKALLERAVDKGWRVYLLGAEQSVIDEVQARCMARWPKLVLAGCRNGYWRPGEEAQVVADITRARPDLLFVALGSPQKERFLGAYQAAMRVPFAMGVGGSFDVIAGKVRRAPIWMQRAGLEWFFRFLQEPRRMFRRYFIEDMAFASMLLNEWRHNHRGGSAAPSLRTDRVQRADTVAKEPLRGPAR